MNAFRFANGSYKSRWMLVATLCVAATGCNEPTTQAQNQPTEQGGGGFILANHDGTMPEIQGIHVAGALEIKLPPDQSSFLKGADTPVDTTVCNSCHTPADIAKYVAPPGPRFRLVKDQCGSCHSADYTSSQPILTRATWQKVVVKMADKFGANEIKLVQNGIVTDHPHQPLMLDYITAVYGK